MEQKKINSRMKELAEKIKFPSNDIHWLKQAMYTKKLEKKENDGKNSKNYSNERLELLGDSVLKLTIIEFFLDNDINLRKGDIDGKRQKIENNDNLKTIRDSWNIKEFIYNDKYFFNEAPEHEKISLNDHDIIVEAIIGAIYKTVGYEKTKEWIIDKFNLYSYL